MSKYHISYSIRLWVECDNALADKFLDALNKNENPDELIGTDWDYSITKENVTLLDKTYNCFVFFGSGYEDGEFTPGCRYTSNGDGYPDDWDPEDGDFIEDDLRTFIDRFDRENEGFKCVRICVWQ